MPGAILPVHSVRQQELLRLRSAGEKEPFSAGGVQQPLLHPDELNVQHPLQIGLIEVSEDDRLVNAVDKLGRKFSPGCFQSSVPHLSLQTLVLFRGLLAEPDAAQQHVGHLGGAQVARHKNDRLRKVHFPVVSQRQRRFVQDAKQQLPEGVAGLFDFIQQQQGKLQVISVPLIQSLLGQHGVCFSVPQIARRRADQLGDPVAVLKFGAVNLDERAAVAQQRLGCGLPNPCFPGSSGAQKQQVAHGTAGWIHSGQKDLVHRGDRLNGFILAYDLCPQRVFQFPGPGAFPFGVQCHLGGC